MVSYHSETTQHYNETMENLKVINETIAYLLEVHVFQLRNFQMTCKVLSSKNFKMISVLFIPR